MPHFSPMFYTKQYFSFIIYNYSFLGSMILPHVRRTAYIPSSTPAHEYSSAPYAAHQIIGASKTDQDPLAINRDLSP
jgi:hypothetical protein